MDLCTKPLLPCKGCGLVYYCSSVHMREDQLHRQLCYGLRQLVERNGKLGLTIEYLSITIIIFAHPARPRYILQERRL